MNFRATLDTKTQVITAIVILALFAAACLPSKLSGDSHAPTWLIMGLPIFVLLLIFITYGFSINGYIVDNEQITIERFLGNVIIPRAEISKTEHLTTDISKHGFRLFGSGGFFGYYGVFTNPTLKKFTLYGTQTQNYVLIQTTSGKKIVVTPDDADGFVDSLN